VAQRPSEDRRGRGIVSGPLYRVPGAAATCRLVVPDETAEVRAVPQAFMKRIHTCSVPRTGLGDIGQDFPPAAQRRSSWVPVGELPGARSHQGCVSDSPRGARAPKCQKF